MESMNVWTSIVVPLFIATIPSLLGVVTVIIQLNADKKKRHEEREEYSKLQAEENAANQAEVTKVLVNAIQQQNETEDEALRCILRTHILNLYSRHSQEHNYSLTLEESENLHKLFSAYTALGGNSFASNLYNIMNNWKIVED